MDAVANAERAERSWGRPTLEPLERAPTRSDWVWFAMLTAMFLLSVFTAPFDAAGSPNAPLKMTVEESTGGGLCINRRVLGFDCGGCGLTRAFVQIGHGNLDLAVSLNPIAPLLFVMFAGLWIESTCLVGFKKRLRWNAPKPLTWLFYAACIAGLLTLSGVRAAEALLGHTVFA